MCASKGSFPFPTIPITWPNALILHRTCGFLSWLENKKGPVRELVTSPTWADLRAWGHPREASSPITPCTQLSPNPYLSSLEGGEIKQRAVSHRGRTLRKGSLKFAARRAGPLLYPWPMEKIQARVSIASMLPECAHGLMYISKT